MARTTLYRITLSSLEPGMKIRFDEDARGIGRFMVVASVEFEEDEVQGRMAHTVSRDSIKRTFTAESELYVVPAEGEVWA